MHLYCRQTQLSIMPPDARVTSCDIRHRVRRATTMAVSKTMSTITTRRTRVMIWLTVCKTDGPITTRDTRNSSNNNIQRARTGWQRGIKRTSTLKWFEHINRQRIRHSESSELIEMRATTTDQMRCHFSIHTHTIINSNEQQTIKFTLHCTFVNPWSLSFVNNTTRLPLFFLFSHLTPEKHWPYTRIN